MPVCVDNRQEKEDQTYNHTVLSSLYSRRNRQRHKDGIYTDLRIPRCIHVGLYLGVALSVSICRVGGRATPCCSRLYRQDCELCMHGTWRVIPVSYIRHRTNRSQLRVSSLLSVLNLLKEMFAFKCYSFCRAFQVRTLDNH